MKIARLMYEGILSRMGVSRPDRNGSKARIMYDRILHQIAECVPVRNNVRTTFEKIKYDYTSKGEEKQEVRVFRDYRNYLKRYGLKSEVEIKHFHLGESAWGPSKAVEDIIYAAASSYDDLRDYPDPNAGILVEAIAEVYGIDPYTYAGGEGKNFLKFPITIGTGSNEILERVTRSFVRDGSSVMVSPPTFFRFEEAAAHVGAGIVESPLLQTEDGFKWTDENKHQYLKAMGNNSIDLYWLCTPNNPTGTTIPLDDMEEIIAKAAKKKKVVVVDEAYGEYVNAVGSKIEGSAVCLLGKYDNFVVTRTVSKGLGLANIRVGYALASPEITEVLEKMRLQYPISSIDQLMAATAIRDIDHADIVRKETGFERDRIIKELGDDFHFYSSPTNVILLKSKNLKNSAYDEFCKRGFLVNNFDNGYVRLTIRMKEDNDLLIERMRGTQT